MDHFQYLKNSFSPTGISQFADSSSKAFLASNSAGITGYPPSPPLSQSFFSFNHPNESNYLHQNSNNFSFSQQFGLNHHNSNGFQQANHQCTSASSQQLQLQYEMNVLDNTPLLGFPNESNNSMNNNIINSNRITPNNNSNVISRNDNYRLEELIPLNNKTSKIKYHSQHYNELFSENKLNEEGMDILQVLTQIKQEQIECTTSELGENNEKQGEEEMLKQQEYESMEFTDYPSREQLTKEKQQLKLSLKDNNNQDDISLKQPQDYLTDQGKDKINQKLKKKNQKTNMNTSSSHIKDVLDIENITYSGQPKKSNEISNHQKFLNTTPNSNISKTNKPSKHKKDNISQNFSNQLKQDEKRSCKKDTSKVLKDKELSIPSEEQNFDFYHEFCRVHTANLVLTQQIIEINNHRNDNFAKFQRIEKKLDDLKESEGEDRKKRFRRVASMIERHFKCPSDKCIKSYGSEGSLNQHVKIKHPELYSGGPTGSENGEQSMSYNEYEEYEVEEEEELEEDNNINPNSVDRDDRTRKEISHSKQQLFLKSRQESSHKDNKSKNDQLITIPAVSLPQFDTLLESSTPISTSVAAVSGVAKNTKKRSVLLLNQTSNTTTENQLEYANHEELSISKKIKQTAQDKQLKKKDPNNDKLS